MSNRFDFEQQIQKCWTVTDDIREVVDFISDHPSADFTQERALNALIGMAELYELKFNKLWDLFEDVHMKLVRDEAMAREEANALREQLIFETQGYGAGKMPRNQGAG